MRFPTIAFVAMISLVGQWSLAQTLQLPTFTFFSVSTTVSVPDGGGAFLGGIDRAATGRNEFGVPGLPFPGFQSRSIGQDMGASNVWAKVTIHDLDAMDQAILNSPSPNDFSSVSSRGWNNMASFPVAPRAIPSLSPNGVSLAGNWRTEASAAPAGGKVAAEEKDRDAQRATRSTEAESYYARGQKAEADGKPNVAKIYYQMASRRATGDFKRQIEARLDSINGRTSAVAKNSP